MMYCDIQASLDSIFPAFDQKSEDSIPDCETLNQNFSHHNSNNIKLVFNQQNEFLKYPEMGYEERIYQNGIIATRANNWHDFFNAMVWHNFPKTKTAINAIHCHEIQKQKDNIRSRQRDLLTLFDECGVIIMANKSHLEMLRKHKWNELFVENKEFWINGEIKIITFGHAMFEKYLNPYIGMTAQALLFDETPINIDEYVSSGILEHRILLSKKELSPLPVLGIPNWHANQNHDFYANKNYFR